MIPVERARQPGGDALACGDAPAPTLVCGTDVTPQRWRNGGGWTRELLAWPDAADWQVRISVADVERDGPFSTFPGVQRWFAVLEGRGVELVIDGAARRITPLDEALAFDGAATTSARLIDGPTRDLNLMLRGIDGDLHAAIAGVAWRPMRRHAGVYAAVPVRCQHDGSRSELPAGSLLWFAATPRSLSVEPLMARPDDLQSGCATAPLKALSASSARPASSSVSGGPAAWWIEAGALFA
jgi:environmental stress-induced protein Ves